MLILIAGLPGSGKSYFGKKLADSLGAFYLNSDQVRIKMRAGGRYSDDDKLRVYRQMLDEASKALAKGANIVVDATFYRQSLRAPFATLARARQIPLYIIEVRSDESTIRRRLSASRETSEADFKVYERIRDEFEEITTPHLVLNSTDHNSDEMSRNALDYIGHERRGSK